MNPRVRSTGTLSSTTSALGAQEVHLHIVWKDCIVESYHIIGLYHETCWLILCKC